MAVLAGHHPASRKLHRPTNQCHAGCSVGFGSLSGGWELTSSGDWASNNPALAVSRGPPSTPPLTSGPGYCFSDMLLSPHLSDPGKSSGPGVSFRVPPSSAGDTNRAPRGVHGPLDHPTAPRPAVPRLNALAGNADADVLAPQPFTQVRLVVGFVRVQFLRLEVPASVRDVFRLEPQDHGLQVEAVVGAGGGEPDGQERRGRPEDHKVLIGSGMTCWAQVARLERRQGAATAARGATCLVCPEPRLADIAPSSGDRATRSSPQTPYTQSLDITHVSPTSPVA